MHDHKSHAGEGEDFHLPPELAELEWRAMLGSLASIMAHDLNNILTVGCASAELLPMGKGLSREQAELVQDIGESFNRMAEMARRWSDMGRAGTRGPLHAEELRSVLEEEFRRFQSRPGIEECRLTFTAPDPVSLPLCAPLVQHLLRHLLCNAVEAVDGAGRVEARLALDGNTGILEVHDSGPGIPEELQTRVFDAFYTTKPGRHGLGLLTVKAVAQMHRGRVIAMDSPLGGACFRVTLPTEKLW